MHEQVCIAEKIVTHFETKLRGTGLWHAYKHEHLIKFSPQLASILDATKVEQQLEDLFFAFSGIIGEHDVRKVGDTIKLISKKPDPKNLAWIIKNLKKTQAQVQAMETNVDCSVMLYDRISDPLYLTIKAAERIKESVSSGHPVDFVHDRAIADTAEMLNVLLISATKRNEIPLIPALHPKEGFFNGNHSNKTNKKFFKPNACRLLANLCAGLDWVELGGQFLLQTESKLNLAIIRHKKRGSDQDILEKKLRKRGFELPCPAELTYSLPLR